MAIVACGNDRHGYGALLLRLEESRSTAALAVAATDGPLLRRVQRIVRARPARVDLGATWFAGVATMLPVLFILPLSGPSISATRERVAPIALSSTQTVTQTAPRQQPPSASVVQPSSRSTTMRRSSVLAAAAALTVAATQIAAQVSPNLSGRWILIPDPTNPTGDWSDGRELAIEQTDETLSIVHDGATITFHVEQSDSRSVVTKGPVRVSFAGFELAIGPTADSAYIKGSWQGATFNVSTPLSDKIRPAFAMMTFSLDAGELIVQTDIPATASQPAKHIVQRFRRA
jgi:hypothetical protein